MWYEERVRARNEGKDGRGPGGSTSTLAAAGSSGVVGGSRAGGVRANVVGSVSAPMFGNTDGGGTLLASLSPEQMQVLLNLINIEQSSHERTAVWSGL